MLSVKCVHVRVSVCFCLCALDNSAVAEPPLLIRLLVFGEPNPVCQSDEKGSLQLYFKETFLRFSEGAEREHKKEITFFILFNHSMN